jgi:2'-5' RNA ligase
MPGRRLFVAVPVAPGVCERVGDLVASVRAAVREREERERRGDRREARWVRIDGLHLTLRFLGPTLDERIPAIEEAMRAAAAATAPFPVALAGGGAFPGPTRPRVLWVGVARGGEQLAELARRLEDGLVAAGWDRDERPFRAHLTLARSDGIPAGAMTAAALVEAARSLDETWLADRLVLFESHTGGGPARYEALREATLGS